MDFFEMMKKNVSYKTKFIVESVEVQKKSKRLVNEFNNLGEDEDDRKNEVLRKLFGKASDAMVIEAPFHCDYGYNIFLHGFVLMNYNVTILDTSPVNIGDCVFMGPNVVLACAGHGIHPDSRYIETSGPITIKNKVWLGANVTVLSGVTIGENTVIGAGSVVTKDIPSNVVACGNPCRVLRKINENDLIDLMGKDFVFSEK